MPNRPRSGLNSGLDVIEVLGASGSATLTEVAQRLSMSKSGVHSLLAILLDRHYAERTEDGAYRLGRQARELGAGSHSLELARLAAPVMAALADTVDEGCILGRLVGFEVSYLHLVESRQPVRVNADVGARIPAHCTSTGLALLAAQTDERIRATLPDALDAVTPHTITDRGELLREIQRTRARGYAVNRGGWRLDVGGVAVAVLDEQRRVVAGLCVAAPLYRMNRAWFDRIVPATLAAAQCIAEGLGGASVAGRRGGR